MFSFHVHYSRIRELHFYQSNLFAGQMVKYKVSTLRRNRFTTFFTFSFLWPYRISISFDCHYTFFYFLRYLVWPGFKNNNVIEKYWKFCYEITLKNCTLINMSTNNNGKQQNSCGVAKWWNLFLFIVKMLQEW